MSSSSAAVLPTKSGQRYPTPSPGLGDRVFYQSLWEEKGVKSPMALIWVIEWGCLSAADAEKYYPDYLKVKGKAA